MGFEGFTTPTRNYFPMPNEWIDICAKIDNLAELKVIQYVLRHTWGYHEFGITKAITIDEFMRGRKRQDGTRIDSGTGLKSDRSVKDGLKAAIEHGYLIYDIDDTDKARIKKSYALKMSSELRGVDTTPQDSQNRGVDTTPLTGSIYPSGGQNLPPNKVVSTHRSEKDTIERHLKKDTIERQGRSLSGESDAPTENVTHIEEMRKRKTDPHLPAIAKGQAHGTDHSSTGDNIFPPGHDSHDRADSESAGAAEHARLAQTLSTIPPGSVQQGAMAMTPREIKAQAERREKELWVIFETELGTRYSATQRKLHKDGIALLIADDISDEPIREGLRALNTFERRTFTVFKFYGWL